MTDKSSNELEERIECLEALLIEQEHRFVATWSNFLRRGRWTESSKKRTAAVKALLFRFVPRLGPISVGFAFATALTVYFAYQANVKLENQNKLLVVQNELQEAQRR